MDGSNVHQSTTPDGHSHPPQSYDHNVGSGASGVTHQMSPDPEHSMDWQDASFISNEADEVIPEDEDEAAYKRRKARERQRRKRQRDRAAGIGRNGQPAAPRRYPGTDVAQYDGTNPFADPPPDPTVLASMSPDEARKEKMRRAARERQRKHRAVVRARRAEDESGATPQPQPSAGGSNSGGSGNTPAVPEGPLPVSAPEPPEEPHIEQEVSPGESHPVSYEQPPAFYYPPPAMWSGGAFPTGQFFHPHSHPGPFVQNGQMMPPHMMPMLPPHQQPPQTMNPMQMQVSPAPPSPQPTETPAPAPTPSPAPAPAPEPSPISAPAPQPNPAPPATSVAPAPASAPAPTPTTAPTPAPAPTSTPAAVPAASSIGLQMSALMSLAAPAMAQPPPSHTPGQTFAMIISLALNSSQSQLLRAHMMQQLRLTIVEMTELEGVMARAFDAWDRERGGEPSNQLQQAMQIPGALGMFHHMPPAQSQPAPQPAPAPSQTPTTQPQPPPTQQPSEPTMPQQSPPQTRVHAPPSTPQTPQNQPRPPRTSTTTTTTSRRSLGVGQPQQQTPTQSQPGGTLNVPRPIAGRSVSVGGPSIRNVGLGTAQVAPTPGPPNEQSQRTVSQPQRHPHTMPSVRSASSVALPIAGQKRPAPGSSQPGPSQTRPMHSAPVPPGQNRSATQPSPRIQTRPQPAQQHSRPGSQPQTPVMAPTNGGNGNKPGNNSAVNLTMPVIGQ